MGEKFNNATPQRPAGHRALDGPLVPVDLPKFIVELKNEPAYHENGKNAITVFKSEHTTVTLVALKKGEKFKSGPEEGHLLMSLYTIAGNLTFSVADDERYLSEGQLLNYHYDFAFKAQAQSDCICLLTVTK
jgi:hypothetical protein